MIILIINELKSITILMHINLRKYSARKDARNVFFFFSMELQNFNTEINFYNLVR